MSVPYCEVASVKEVLRLAVDYTDSDAEISRCIGSADRMLRSWAKSQSLFIQENPVPDDIADASKHLAAWSFKIHGDPPINDQTLYDLARNFFDSWAAGANPGYVGVA